jgi:putative Mn2+ efflux pump MntP
MMPIGGVHALGSLVLIFMGIWFLLDALAKRNTEPAPNVSGGSFAALCSLSAALGVNNTGAGVAAGISGVSPFWGGAVNFGVTLAALALGHKLGRLTAGKPMGGWALACSGFLLLLLGLWGLLT